MEYDHTTLPKFLKSRAGLEIPSNKESDLRDADEMGHLQIQAAVLYDNFRYAAHSLENIMIYCMDRNIRVTFADTSKKILHLESSEKFLNLRDPATRQAAELYLQKAIDPEDNISAEGPVGMAIRNKFMTSKIDGIMQKRKPEIVVVHCGHQHIWGNINFRFSFQDSLAHNLSLLGHSIFSIIPKMNSTIAALIEENPNTNNRLLTLDNFPQLDFWGKTPAEDAIVSQIIKASGGIITRHTPRIQRWKSCFISEGEKLFDRVLE